MGPWVGRRPVEVVEVWVLVVLGWSWLGWSWWGWLDAEAVGGDDAVVEDVVDVGLGGEAAEGGGVVFGCGGLDGGDAKVLAALGEADSGEGDADFGVGGDSGVVVDDEVAMRHDAVGVDLCSRVRAEKKARRTILQRRTRGKRDAAVALKAGTRGVGWLRWNTCCTS